MPHPCVNLLPPLLHARIPSDDIVCDIRDTQCDIQHLGNGWVLLVDLVCGIARDVAPTLLVIEALDLGCHATPCHHTLCVIALNRATRPRHTYAIYVLECLL